MQRLARFQAFLESLPDAIVIVDKLGYIVGINALAETMFGYTREEVAGARVEILVPERFRSRHEEERKAYSQSPRTRPMGFGRDLWGRRKSGEEFPIQISLSPIDGEGETFVTSIIRDVTAQRAAEDRFRALLESAPDGIVVVDSTGTIVMVNSQTERLFEYARADLIGKRVELLVPTRARVAHESERSTFLENPKLRPMGGGRPLTGLKRSGVEFPVEISLSPLVTDQGRMVMSIVRDITERRRAEETIQASLREKEALLKEIHHRVKNNLQVTSSLLRLQSGAVEDQSVKEMFAETEARIRSMALVHEKLYQSTNLAHIDFGDYIRSLAQLLLRSTARDRGNVTVAVSGETVFLQIDEAVPCGLIVNELLSNALKHAFPGDRNGRLDVELEDRDGRAVALTVRDDGIGLPRGFDLASTGTLGLLLVQGLVQQIDGKLEVERAHGGAAFRITFQRKGGRWQQPGS